MKKNFRMGYTGKIDPALKRLILSNQPLSAWGSSSGPLVPVSNRSSVIPIIGKTLLPITSDLNLYETFQEADNSNSQEQPKVKSQLQESKNGKFSPEILFRISEFMDLETCIEAAKVCRAWRRIYFPLSWVSCVVDLTDTWPFNFDMSSNISLHKSTSNEGTLCANTGYMSENENTPNLHQNYEADVDYAGTMDSEDSDDTRCHSGMSESLYGTYQTQLSDTTTINDEMEYSHIEFKTESLSAHIPSGIVLGKRRVLPFMIFKELCYYAARGDITDKYKGVVCFEAISEIVFHNENFDLSINPRSFTQEHEYVNEMEYSYNRLITQHTASSYASCNNQITITTTGRPTENDIMDVLISQHLFSIEIPSNVFPFLLKVSFSTPLRISEARNFGISKLCESLLALNSASSDMVVLQKNNSIISKSKAIIPGGPILDFLKKAVGKCQEPKQVKNVYEYPLSCNGRKTANKIKGINVISDSSEAEASYYRQQFSWFSLIDGLKVKD